MLLSVCALCECPIDIISNDSKVTIDKDTQLTSECLDGQTLYNVTLEAVDRTTPLFSELAENYMFVDSVITVEAPEDASSTLNLLTDKVNSL